MSDLIDRQGAIDIIDMDKMKPEIAPSLGSTAERDFKIYNHSCNKHIELIKQLPSAQPEHEILDELMVIMKEYYFTHRYEYDEAWENGFAKCMNLIPNVYMKREKDR